MNVIQIPRFKGAGPWGAVFLNDTSNIPYVIATKVLLHITKDNPAARRCVSAFKKRYENGCVSGDALGSETMKQLYRLGHAKNLGGKKPILVAATSLKTLLLSAGASDEYAREFYDHFLANIVGKNNRQVEEEEDDDDAERDSSPVPPFKRLSRPVPITVDPSKGKEEEEEEEEEEGVNPLWEPPVRKSVVRFKRTGSRKRKIVVDAAEERMRTVVREEIRKAFLDEHQQLAVKKAYDDAYRSAYKKYKQQFEQQAKDTYDRDVQEGIMAHLRKVADQYMQGINK